jgi:hypothetical protein
MKSHQVRFALIAALASLTATMAFAQAAGHDSAPAAQAPAVPPAIPAEKLPATAAETLAAIKRQHSLLKAAFKEGKLSEVQAQALTLNELVQHIVNQVPADHQASVKEIADRHSKLTEALTKASAAGAQKEVEANIFKLTGNLRALQLQAH